MFDKPVLTDKVEKSEDKILSRSNGTSDTEYPFQLRHLIGTRSCLALSLILACRLLKMEWNSYIQKKVSFIPQKSFLS